MAIRITGMYSGLDTESIISELVSAQSVKKSSLVKAQTKLSWKQDAWKALNTKIFDFYTNVLSDMRYEGSYMKKTTKISNPNAISVITGADAVDGVRTVKVDQLAQGGYLTGGNLTTPKGVMFTGGATLDQICKQWGDSAGFSGSGSINVVGANGVSVKIDVSGATTIDDFVKKIQSTGLNASYDQENQRINISSKGTGEACNFNLVANDGNGLKALATLGLLTTSDLGSEENKKWAAYSDGAGGYTQAFYDAVDAEIKRRADALKAQNDKLTEANGKLDEANQKLFDDMDDTDHIGAGFMAKYGVNLSDLEGLYDTLMSAKADYDDKVKNGASQTDIDNAKAAADAAQTAYDDLMKKAVDYINDECYGPLVDKKDADGNIVYEQKKDADGNLMYEQAKNDDGSLKYEQKKDADGNLVFEADGTTPVYDMDKPVYDKTKPIYDTTKPVKVREGGGLKDQWEEQYKAGSVDPALQAKVDSLNKWNSALTSLEKNRTAIDANNAQMVKNAESIEADGTAKQQLKDAVNTEFENKVSAALDSEKILEDWDKLQADPNDPTVAADSLARKMVGSKVDAQDAIIHVNGAEYTSLTNNFSINGLKLTVQEVTDKEVTLTTSTDTDGIYSMIKNFLTEYNKLINEMDGAYNAESSKGYDPLTSEEKEALSESEIEEWEKKIKDSLLRRDSTLSSVSFAMVSVMMQGTTVNGKNMYLSDFGINTLGYFKSAENEKHAYHIDGDPDDSSVKANADKLKAAIATNPEAVTGFFTNLATNMYDTLTEKMASTTLSSAFTVYNDKQMKEEYDSYKDKIAAQEEKLNKMMDKWYKKFSAMEVAMSKLESRSSSLSSLFGG